MPMPAATPVLHTDAPQRCQLCAARMNCVVGQLPRPLQERLDPLIRERGFRKGETLQQEDTAPSTVSSIKLGTVMLMRSGPDGQPRPVALVGRGHLLGRCALLGGPTLVGVQALSPGRVCELPIAALRNLLETELQLCGTLRHHMTQAFANLADWAQVMRLRGLPRQLMASLMLLAREQGTRTVHLPSQVALAALLSTSRESVARALRMVEEKGYLQRIDRWHGELTGTHRHIFQSERDDTD